MDLIETLKNEVGNYSINLISQKTGESEERAKAGVFAAIPAVLAGIIKKGSGGSSGFLSSLMPGLATTESADRPVSNLNDEGDSLLERGQTMLGDLFGKDTDSVTNAVSDSSGISREKSSSVLAMAVPLIMSALSKVMNSKGWSTSDLLGKLFENRSGIASALPGNLGTSLGLASMNVPDLDRRFEAPGTRSDIPPVKIPPITPSSTEIPHREVDPVRHVQHDAPVSSGGSFLKWLIPLILIALAAWWLLGKKGCNESADTVITTDSLNIDGDSMMGSATGAVTGALNEAGDWIYDLGPDIKKKLPDGTEITIGENSVENRLISFIEDDTREVDKTTWFSFDRLYFETGKSGLKPESKEQLANVAAIMKAYPEVKIKLGGYTDSTGDAAVNKRLSNDRAQNAMQELARLGVANNRMEAEGYGPGHPLATNETPEGRAQNRRIDIRVTAK